MAVNAIMPMAVVATPIVINALVFCKSASFGAVVGFDASVTPRQKVF
jgi:hypothetical protein